MILEFTITDSDGNADLSEVQKAFDTLSAKGLSRAVQQKGSGEHGGVHEILQFAADNEAITVALIGALADIMVAVINRGRKATLRKDDLSMTFQGKVSKFGNLLAMLKSFFEDE